MRKFLHDNGLGLAALGLFVAFWIAMAIAGYRSHNEEQLQHSQPPVAFLAYLLTGHFWEATMENWESEFLQMGVFVLLTAFLVQIGSAESKSDQEHGE